MPAARERHGRHAPAPRLHVAGGDRPGVEACGVAATYRPPRRVFYGTGPATRLQLYGNTAVARAEPHVPCERVQCTRGHKVDGETARTDVIVPTDADQPSAFSQETH